MSPATTIRLCAGFDLAITALFVLPFIATFTITLLFAVNGWVSSSLPMPVFTPLNMLFVNLMGGLGVVWAIARLLHPVALLGWIDAWARLWVSALLIYFLTQPSVPIILSLFLATELLGAWLQFWILRPDE